MQTRKKEVENLEMLVSVEFRRARRAVGVTKHHPRRRQSLVQREKHWPPCEQMQAKVVDA